MARGQLKSVLTGKLVQVSCYKRNRNRDVCRILADGADVGLEMVRRGFAWYAFQFAHEQTRQERQGNKGSERNAKSHRPRLWADAGPMPARTSRKLRKAGQNAVSQCETSPDGSGSCHI